MSDGVVGSDRLLKYGMRGYRESVSYNWHGQMIDIRCLLDRETEIALIRSIIDCCSTEDGEIIPEFVDLATRANIVSYYANVALPDDIDMQHKLLYSSDLYDVIIKNANAAQVNNVICTVSRYVDGLSR